MSRVVIIADGKAAQWASWKKKLEGDAEYVGKVSEFIVKYPDIVAHQPHSGFEVDAVKLASNPEAIASLAHIVNLALNVDAKEKTCYDTKIIPTEKT